MNFVVVGVAIAVTFACDGANTVTFGSAMEVNMVADIDGRMPVVNGGMARLGAVWNEPALPVTVIAGSGGGIAVVGTSEGTNIVSSADEITVTATQAMSRPFVGFEVNGEMVSNPGATYSFTPATAAGSVTSVRAIYETEWYVDCVNGDDANNGAFGHPKRTIRAATTNALSGDIIRVASGTYGDAEGTQTVGSTGASRVVIPANVTLESTDGADVTFIVGAEATDDQIDNETYKTGANGVRCVYAKSGATIRGFTLMGGRGTGEAEADGKGRGSAFYSETARAAAVEGCIVTNNAAYIGTIYQAVVKRCRVVGNIGTRKSSAGVTCAGNGGPAGNLCSWYGSIIDGNIGGATVLSAYAFENCTIGIRNSMPPSDTPQVLWWYGPDDRAIVNSVILGGRYYFGGGGKLYCTNCLVMADKIGTVLKREQSYNTIFTNTSAAQVDSKTYGPILGRFAGIDSGDSTFSSAALGDKDVYDTPRVLNGTLDIGAVEYDWRTTFAVELGRRFMMTYASPSVTTNAAGGLIVPGGAVAGTATSAGPHAITFTLTGGSLAVYVGGILVGESSGTGEQSIRFNVANVADEIRFVYTPEAGSTAVLSRFSGANGFIISYR